MAVARCAVTIPQQKDDKMPGLDDIDDGLEDALTPAQLKESSAHQTAMEMARVAGVDVTSSKGQRVIERTQQDLMAADARRKNTVDRAARKRAFRAAYMRKLEKLYRLYMPFTAHDAALRMNATPEEVERYLIEESALDGSRVTRHADSDTEFCIVSRFD